MKVIDFNGKTLDKEVIKAVEVAMNTSSCIVRKPLDTWVNPEQRKSSFLLLSLKDKSGRKVAEEVYFFDKTKNLELPQTAISMKVKQLDGKCELTLSSPKLAKMSLSRFLFKEPVSLIISSICCRVKTKNNDNVSGD